jgi:hypothetical protein
VVTGSPMTPHTHWQPTKAHRAQCSGLQGTCPLAGSRWARKFLPSREEVMPTNGPASATEACWEATTAVRATASDLAKTMSGGGDRGDTHAHTWMNQAWEHAMGGAGGAGGGVGPTTDSASPTHLPRKVGAGICSSPLPPSSHKPFTDDFRTPVQ